MKTTDNKRLHEEEVSKRISMLQDKIDNHEYTKTEGGLNNLIKRELMSINTNQEKIDKLNYKISMIHSMMASDQDFLELKKELIFYENYRNISKLIDEGSKYVHVNDFVKQFIKVNPELLNK